MDQAAKKQLIDKLAVAKNFDKGYPKESWRWFVDRLIRTFEAQGLGDAQVTSKVSEVVTKSKPIVKAKRDFAIGLKFGKSLQKIQEGRRIEILYGAIASHPELVDTANSAVLDWVAKRRLRSVSRMDFFVNPNSQGYFRYPDECPADERWRVNVDAAVLWRPVTAKDYPIALKRPAAGTIDYVKAVRSLFVAKKKACDGNLLDCATTASAVFLDSLLEAKDAQKFLGKLDSKGATYLEIDHVREADFVKDVTSEGLFVPGEGLVDDLQVGDHVYIYNHPLYKVFRPTGSWRGEHSLVFNCGDRKVQSKTGFHFGGHGMEGTVYKFYDRFLVELQTLLHRAYRIGAVYLIWMQTGGMSLPPNSVSLSDHTVVMGGVTRSLRLFEFDVTFKYNDYEKAPTKQKRRPTRTESKFVIARVPSLNRFYLAEKKTRGDVLAAGITKNAIRFDRNAPPPAGPDEFDPVTWEIYYYDESTSSGKHFAPFQRVKGKVAFKPLSIDALFESPFSKRDPKKEEIKVISTRAVFSGAYKSFLSTNGAI